jgi:hypothetical protein
MVDEPITVTKDEVMVDVVRPPYVEVGVVEVGLFWEIDDGDGDGDGAGDEEVVVVGVGDKAGVWDEDGTDEVVEVAGWDVGVELELSELVDEVSDEDFVNSGWDDLVRVKFY